MHLSIDLETASEVDLKRHGVDRYASHPSTRILMIAWGFDGEDVQVHDCTVGVRMPARLEAALRDPSVILHAYNATFERTVIRKVWGINISASRFRCTMIRAYQQSFMGTLGQIGGYVGLPDEMQKDKEGDRLIRLFSMPQRVTKNQPYVWRDSLTDPVDWKRFLDYCRRDVIAEREVLRRLDRYPSPAVEQHYYAMTEGKNDAGIPIDRQFVTNGIAMAARRRAELTVELKALTALPNPNSPVQFTTWLRERGYPFADINKVTVKKVIAEHQEGLVPQTAEVMRALRLRQQAARTSPKKFDAILDRAGDDDLMRHAFQFCGASRTNRESGRGAQPHNFPRPPGWLEDEALLDEVTDTIRRGDYDWLTLLAAEPLDAIVGTIRSSFRAPDGYEWVVADLAAIESAVFAYLSRDDVLMDIVRSGRDPYKVFATFWFGVLYEEVTKKQRGMSKPAMLGCFGADTLVLTHMGWKAITETHTTDLLWDGVEWVRHDGCVNQGDKQVINMYGVDVTPDHEVLCGDDWRTACDVMRNGLYERQAIGLATGTLPAPFAKDQEATTYTIIAFAQTASLNATFTETTLRREKVAAVSLVQTNAVVKPKTVFMCVSANKPHEKSLIDLPIVTMRLFRVATAKVRKPTDTGVGVFNVDLPMFMISSATCSPWTAAAICRLRSTVKITTAIMSAVTFECLIAPVNYATPVRTTGLSITVNDIALRISGVSLHLGTCPLTLSDVKLVRVSRPSRSSLTKSSARVRTTYDLVNCGPRNRFTILTDAGPMIVHNCQYRLGGGQLRDGKKTGLWGYGEAMGVMLTQAESKEAVDVWRGRFVAGRQYWFDLEEAIMTTIRTGARTRVGCMTFDLMKPYLRAELPTGRFMYYHLPRVSMERGVWPDGTPYERPQISYMGKNQNTGRWERIYSHGGKFAENFTQALAREVLYIGAARAHAAGFDIRLKVHDEVGAIRCIGDERYSLARLVSCLSDPIDSLPGLPLRAEGWVGPYYRK